MIVADTDVLIDFLAGSEPMASRIALELGHADLHTTAITRFELVAGARSPRQQVAVADLLAALPVLRLAAAAADRAAAVRLALEAKGQPIGMADCLIAGIVLEHDGILLTRNLRHFKRVEGLAVSPVYE